MPRGRGLQELRLVSIPHFCVGAFSPGNTLPPAPAAWDVSLSQVLHQEIVEEVLVGSRGLVAPPTHLPGAERAVRGDNVC